MRRICKRVGCCLFALWLAALAPLAVSAQSLEEIQAQQEQLQAENQQLQTQLDSLREDQAQKQAYLETLQEQISLVQEQILTTRENIQDLNESIGQLTLKLEASQAEVQDTIDLFKQRLVALYLDDGWKPDVILLCCAESARQGRRSVAAIARELTRWRENGVETGEDAERYLRQAKQREAWCAEAAAQFGIEPAALTRWERGAIARWHEEWGVGREMIDEALLRAGSKNTVRYVDGILRAWRAQGITTVEAARGQGQLAGSNILATERPAAPRPAASAQKDLFNRDWAAQFNEED